MQKYYKIVKQCEEKLNDSNSLDEKKYYRNRVLKYAVLVSARPFALEKARGNEEIWQAIRDGFIRMRRKKDAVHLWKYDFCKRKISENSIPVFQTWNNPWGKGLGT